MLSFSPPILRKESELLAEALLLQILRWIRMDWLPRGRCEVLLGFLGKVSFSPGVSAHLSDVSRPLKP